MHRFRSWTLDPPEWRTQRNRLLPVEGGDGSTLSLDFTTGVLDPRLTFTASSNGTFINSQGYVENRAQNLVYNTSWLVSSLPTGWALNGSSNGSYTWNNNGSVTFNCTSGQRHFITPGFPYITTTPGLVYTASIKIVSTTNAPTFGEVFSIGGGNGSGVTLVSGSLKINGSSSGVTSNSVVTAGDVLSMTVTASSTTTQWYPRFGLGVDGPISTTKSVTIAEPQANIGNIAQSFVVNNNTNTGYFAPRFNCNQLTGTINGLLMEPETQNFVYSSIDLSLVSTWSQAGTGIIVVGSQGPSPDGLNNATKIAPGSGGIYIESTLGTLASNTVYTFSCFVKKLGSNQYAPLSVGTGGAYVGSGPFLIFDFNNPSASVISGGYVGWGYTALQNGWYRVTYTGTTSATPAGAKIRFRLDNGVGADGYLIYGPQVEERLGASSYIPTGSSLVTRLQDSAILSNVSSINFNTTKGTIVLKGFISKVGTGYARNIKFSTITPAVREAWGIPVNDLTLFYSCRTDATPQLVIRELTRTYSLNTPFSFAGTINAEEATNTMHISLNGSSTSGNRSNAGSMPAIDGIRFNYDTGATAYSAMCIKSLKYWPTNKTLEEVITLSNEL